jgi:thioredoxin-dependent peroxiredoxin
VPIAEAYGAGYDQPMIDQGDQASDFTLPDQDGNPVKLSDLQGQPVIVYFYPKADTRS